MTYDTPRDYRRLNKVVSIQKAQLTRAKKSGDSRRVIRAVRNAVREWNEMGLWPDGWATWQAALNDAMYPDRAVDLRDLD